MRVLKSRGAAVKWREFFGARGGWAVFALLSILVLTF